MFNKKELETKTRKELNQICREEGIPGFSRVSKAQLINIIIAFNEAEDETVTFLDQVESVDYEPMTLEEEVECYGEDAPSLRELELEEREQVIKDIKAGITVTLPDVVDEVVVSYEEDCLNTFSQVYWDIQDIQDIQDTQDKEDKDINEKEIIDYVEYCVSSFMMGFRKINPNHIKAYLDAHNKGRPRGLKTY